MITHDVNDRVRVTVEGPYLDETGRIVLRSFYQDSVVYHVLFDHDLAALPTPYLANELENL